MPGAPGGAVRLRPAFALPPSRGAARPGARAGAAARPFRLFPGLPGPDAPCGRGGPRSPGDQRGAEGGAPSPGKRARQLGQLAHLLPDRLVPRRSHSKPPVDRPLSQRDAGGGARHRPRFSPGHPRGADPTGVPALRPGARGAGLLVRHLQAAQRRAGHRQGVGAAAPGPGQAGQAQRRRVQQAPAGGDALAARSSGTRSKRRSGGI